MARKIISKKTITFYEGDETLLDEILKAAENDKRTFSTFAMMALINAVEKREGEEKTTEEKMDIPTESADALNGW